MCCIKEDTIKPYIKLYVKKNCFQAFFLEDWNVVQLFVSWDKLIQIIGALDEYALSTQELLLRMFSKKCLQMIAKVLLVYIPVLQLDLEYNYDGDNLFNDLLADNQSRQTITHLKQMVSPLGFSNIYHLIIFPNAYVES